MICRSGLPSGAYSYAWCCNCNLLFPIFRLTVHVLRHRLVLVDGEFVINPTAGAVGSIVILALTVASTREKVIMIEAGANESAGSTR